MAIEKNLLYRVREFVREHHKDFGHYTESGFKRIQLEHLQEVADLVWASGGTDTEIAAAWLHDTVEDTTVKLVEIANTFGSEIADIVQGLTDLDEFKDLPTKERKAKQAERVRSENASIRRIKIADQISNTRFIGIEPLKDWPLQMMRDYVEGARAIAENCKGISPFLDQLFLKEYSLAKQKLRMS